MNWLIQFEIIIILSFDCGGDENKKTRTKDELIGIDRAEDDGRLGV